MERDKILARWALSPWNSWLKDDAFWRDVFVELWARIPMDAIKKLGRASPELLILPPVFASRAVAVPRAIQKGSHILQLDGRLAARGRAQTLGILAHEFAHLLTVDDLEADRIASGLGFASELRLALANDAPASHPRRQQNAA